MVFCAFNIYAMAREMSHLSDVDIAVLDINPECDEACLQTAHNSALGMTIFSLVLDFVVIGLSLLLFKGVRKDRPALMTPFIAYMIATAMFLLFAFVAGVILLARIPVAAAVFSAIMIPCLAISLHFLHVVLTYQRQIRETLGEQPIHLVEEMSNSV